jgi:hypothetical protein
MGKRIWACVFTMLLLAVPAFALTTKSIADGLTADEVAAAVTGPGATITNVRITGSTNAVGTFAEGGLGINSGIILSTGNIADAAGPNDSSGSGASLGAEGDGQLNSIVAPRTTFDAVILEFDVVTKTPIFIINYVFASEEYREYVDDEFNDVFAFYVDGANIATTPGTSQPVTINTINHLRNTNLYRDNETGTATEFDGFTVPMIAIGFVEPNVVHHVKIAIADTADDILDSAVFIEQGGITGTTAPIVITPPTAVEAFHTQPLELALPIYYVFDTIPYTLTASGIPGAMYTFSPVYTGADGRQYTNLKITLGPNTPSGAHSVTIRSATSDAEEFSGFVVVIDCDPPGLLGTGQPVSQTVARGSTVKYTVEPFGSGPFTYQWYTGFRGMTDFPVAGATSATFTTPAVNERGSYWVRISNACGSYDSLAGVVRPQ